MKTKYSIVLLATLNLLIYSFTYSDKNTYCTAHYPEQANTSYSVDDSALCAGVKIPDCAENTVSLEKARLEIAYYQLWQRMLPDSFTWKPNPNGDSAIIDFQSKLIVSKADIDNIEALISDYCNIAYPPDSTSANSHCHGYHVNYPYTFRKEKAIAESYFIPKKDIDGAVNAVLHEGHKCNGFRVYLAGGETTYTSKYHVSSHLLIVPAYVDTTKGGERIDYLLRKENGDKCLLDLTTPCPKTCPDHRILDCPSK